MKISPDEIILFRIPMELFGKSFELDINMTIVGTWGIMLFMLLFFRSLTKNFNSSFNLSPLQNGIEVIVRFVRDQIEGMMGRTAKNAVRYIQFSSPNILRNTVLITTTVNTPKA